MKEVIISEILIRVSKVGTANKVLKRNLSFGLKTDGRVGITKEEFFNKVRRTN